MYLCICEVAVHYKFFNVNFVLGVMDPLVLVFLGYSLAILEYFPEDLLQTIFNIKFLAKLDSQLQSMYLQFIKLLLVFYIQVSTLPLLKHLNVNICLSVYKSISCFSQKTWKTEKYKTKTKRLLVIVPPSETTTLNNGLECIFLSASLQLLCVYLCIYVF